MTGVKFDQVIANRVMTHVLVLSAKVWRNERLKCVVVIDYEHW